MAAPAYQTHTTTAYAIKYGSATYTINNASNVSEGDLLLIVLLTNGEDDNDWNPSISGFTKLRQVDYQSLDSNLSIFAKIAESSDESASTYSLSVPAGCDSNVIGATVFRYTNVTSLDVIQTATWSSNDTTSPSGTLSITPYNEGGALIGVLASIRLVEGGSYASYAIATDNPTWTERVDKTTAADITASSYQESLVAIATADRTESTATGTWSATATGLSTSTDTVAILIFIEEASGASGTATLLEDAEETTFAPTASVGTTGTTALLEDGDETIPAPTSTSQNRVWTNQTKASGTWTNQSK